MSTLVHQLKLRDVDEACTVQANRGPWTQYSSEERMLSMYRDRPLEHVMDDRLSTLLHPQNV